MKTPDEYQIQLERIHNHNLNYAQNHVLVSKKEQIKNKSLFEWQSQMVSDMVGFSKRVDLKKSNQNTWYQQPSMFGRIGTDVGTGKTFLALGIIDQLFKTNALIPNPKKRKIHQFWSAKKVDVDHLPVIKKEEWLKSEKKDVVSCDDLSESERIMLVNGEFKYIEYRGRVIIFVPNACFGQWIWECYCYFGVNYCREHLYTINQDITSCRFKPDFDPILADIQDKHIIIAKHSQIVGFARNFFFNKLPTDYTFVDEYHCLQDMRVSTLYKKLFENTNFGWLISANCLSSHDIFTNLRLNELSYNFDMIKHMIEEKDGLYSGSQPMTQPTEEIIYYRATKFAIFGVKDDIANDLIVADNTRQILQDRLVKQKNETINLHLKEYFTRLASETCNSKYLKETHGELNSFVEDKLDILTKKLKEFGFDFFPKKEDKKNIETIVFNLKEHTLEFNSIIEKDVFLKPIIECTKEYNIFTENLKNNMCLVCLEFSECPLLLVCCKQIICKRCLIHLVRVLLLKCPSCRQDLDLTFSSEINNEESKGDCQDTFLFKYIEIRETLLAKHDKIMIVYDCDFGLSSNLYSSLDPKHYKILDRSTGSTHVTKTVGQMKNNASFKILFVNSAALNHGINLEFIQCILFLNNFRSDSEKKQMIGRAQRYGRTCQLNVIYLKQK